MGSRIDLHNKLAEVLGHDNLYYQQPENFKLKYPCCIYNQETGNVEKASNKLYSYTKRYTITLIYNSDIDHIVETMLTEFNYCSLDNIFINDNLYHYVFTLYY